MMLVPVVLAILLPLYATASHCEKRGIYLECSNLDVSDLVSIYTNEETLKLTNLTGESSWNSTVLTAVNTIILDDAKLNPDAFQDLVKLPHLSSLEITRVENLNSIQTSDFPDGTNLRRLNINHCDLSKVILNLPSLSEVDLSESHFELDPSISGKFLQFVNLSSTGFQNLLSLPDVEELDLSHNQLTTVVFDQLLKLEKLWLNNNNLTEFYATFLNLIFVDLSENSIEVIGNNSFIHLPQLTTINLSGNKITTMDEPFGYNKLLKFLDLSRNQLRNIQANFFTHIKELEILKLNGNMLESLPDLRVTLANLHHIDVSSNQMVGLNPRFFEHVPELAFLDISGNRLKTIDHVTPYLGNLNRLLMSKNSVIVNKKTFTPLKQVNYLDASENGLHITLSVFNENTALKHLYLNSNRITDLCDEKSSPVDIEYLFLRDNQIKSLRCLSKVRYLDVENNPLECNEELKKKLIDLADSIDVLLPATSLVEVFNRSQLELVDGLAMFEKLCPNGLHSTSSVASTLRTTEAELVVKDTELENEARDSVTPALFDVESKSGLVDDSYESYDDGVDYHKLEVNDYSQSQKESIFDVDNGLHFNYHGRNVNGLAVFCLVVSVALGIVLLAIVVVFISQKIRTRREANLGSDRPYKPLKNEVYKTTTAGIETNNRNIAQVFSKFKNDKFDEIMIKFGFKWNRSGDVESETRMIPA